jgi:hypothetical protein
MPHRQLQHVGVLNRHAISWMALTPNVALLEAHRPTTIVFQQGMED